MPVRNKAKEIEAAKRVLARYGRGGDDDLVHMSRAERRIVDAIIGGESVNPHTGLPEYFKWKKVLKGIARAAGAAAGAYFGGPAGAAVGGALATKLTGGSWKTSLGNGLISGLGAYGVQQSGLGIGGLGAGTDLLGRAGTTAASTAASSGGGGGFGIGSMKSLLPVAGIAAAALAPKPKNLATTANAAPPPSMPAVHYQPLDRKPLSYAGDYDTYGQDAGEHQYFDEVNPKGVAMADGGRVGIYEAFKKNAVHLKGGGGGHAASGRGADGRGGAGDGSGKDRDKGGGGFSDAGYANRANTGYSASKPTGGGAPAKTTERHYVDAIDDPAMKSWNAKKDDAANVGESWDDGVAGFFNELGWGAAGLAGISESAPSSFSESAMEDSMSGMPDPSKPTESAHVKFDPVKGLATVAGFVGGLPIGTAYDLGKYGYTTLTGERVPWEMDMGTSMFGGKTPSASQTKNANQNSTTGYDGQEHDGGQGQAVISALSQTFGTGSKPNSVAAAANAGGTGTLPSTTQQPVATGRTYMPLSAYDTYGQQGGEHQFFDQVNPPLSGANGVDRSALRAEDPYGFARGGKIMGPGHGQEDKIPAMLSDGEYVWSAQDVADLGGGSTDAGVSKLDEMRKLVRKNAGRKNINTISKPPLGIGDLMKKVA